MQIKNQKDFDKYLNNKDLFVGSLNDLIKGKSKVDTDLFYGKFPVYGCDRSEDYYALRNKSILCVAEAEEFLDKTCYKTDTPAGFLINKKLVINGDDGDYCSPLDLALSIDSQTQFSLTCLTRLIYPDKSEIIPGYKPCRTMKVYDLEKAHDLVARQIDSEDIRLLDSSPDEKRELSKEDWEAIKKYKKDKIKFSLPRYPELGFTLEGSIYSGIKSDIYWHRISTTLWLDTKTDSHFILGRDEGTYFGCHLAGKPKKIGAAYLDLVPKEIRGKQNIYDRQGEWFFVKVTEEELPEVCDRILESESSDGRDDQWLQRDDKSSNIHYFEHNGLIVGKDNFVYIKNGTIRHNEHKDLEFKGWRKIYKNTALRSVSVEGVD